MRKRLREKLARRDADRRLRDLIVYLVWKLQDSPHPITLAELASKEPGRIEQLLYLIDVTAYRCLGYPLTGRNWIKTADGVDMGGHWRPPKRKAKVRKDDG